MAVEYCNGNAFHGTGQAVVVTVNCVGAMGRGIALECKQRMPWLYSAYRQYCRRGKIKPGAILLPWCLFDGSRVEKDAGHDAVLLFPTKLDWKEPSKPEWIENGLYDLRSIAERKGWKVVDMTLPGAANGWIKDKLSIYRMVDDALGDSKVVFNIWGL